MASRARGMASEFAQGYRAYKPGGTYLGGGGGGIQEGLERVGNGLRNIGSGADDAVAGNTSSISRSEYASLRKKTPNQSVRDAVNPQGPKTDPVYGYEVKRLEADHIVSMKEIVEMPGFADLTPGQRVEVLNLRENFTGLGKSTNASKGASNWSDWRGHSKLGPIPTEVRADMLRRESAAREALRRAIDDRLGGPKQ